MKNVLLFLGIAGVGLYLASRFEARQRKLGRREEALLDLNGAAFEVLKKFHDLGEELAERIGRHWSEVTAWASRRERDPVTWV